MTKQKRNSISLNARVGKYRYVFLGLLLSLVLAVGCSKEPERAEIVYSFSTKGENCQGISYGWLNEDGVNEICHDRFTNGNVEVDCPIPKTVNTFFDLPDDLENVKAVTSYISVSQGNLCNARCEIWYLSELVDSDQVTINEDDHIARCQGRIQ